MRPSEMPVVASATKKYYAWACGAWAGPCKVQPGSAWLDVLIFSGLAIAPIFGSERQVLLELFDGYLHSCSAFVASQLPSSAGDWWLTRPAIGDNVMGRLLHGSQTNALKDRSPHRARPQD